MSLYNLTMIRGRTYKFNGTVTDGGVATTITGNVKMVCKYDLGDKESPTVFTCTLSPSDGISIASLPTGQFNVTIDASKTDSLPVINEVIELQYELVWLPTGGEKWPLLNGTIFVEPRAPNSI